MLYRLKAWRCATSSVATGFVAVLLAAAPAAGSAALGDDSERASAAIAVAQVKLMKLTLSEPMARPALVEERARDALGRAESALDAGDGAGALGAASEAAAIAELAVAKAELRAARERRDRLRAEVAAMSAGQ